MEKIREQEETNDKKSKEKSWEKYVSDFNPKEPQTKVWNFWR